MEILVPSVLFLLGLVIIIKGGDFFVDAAVWIAKVTGVPNILIGATIVSLATTLPELFVSTIATINGSPEMAIGNAVGSTICNIGLILAISVIFMSGNIDKKSFRSKGLLMVGSTLLLFFFSRDKVLSAYEGVVLLVLLVFYIVLNIYEAKISRNTFQEVATTVQAKEKLDSKVIIINISKFVIGSIFIIVGAKLLVNNGQILARFLNIPEQIISLTLIALGTSLPELVTAINAIIKKEHGISIGNIIGANILNITMILGTCSIISPNGLVIKTRNIYVFGNVFKNIPQTLYIDIPVTLVLMSLIVVPGAVFGKIKKANGVLLLGIYIAYISFLALITF